MKKKSIIAAAAMLLAISAVTGCGTDKDNVSNGQENQGVQSGTDAPEAEENKDTQTDKDVPGPQTDIAVPEGDQAKQLETDTSEEEGNPAEGSEEKTEVRREDYPDCDGSGHGYVEIYYSDGSVETEEY